MLKSWGGQNISIPVTWCFAKWRRRGSAAKNRWKFSWQTCCGGSMRIGMGAFMLSQQPTLRLKTMSYILISCFFRILFERPGRGRARRKRSRPTWSGRRPPWRFGCRLGTEAIRSQGSRALIMHLAVLVDQGRRKTKAQPAGSNAPGDVARYRCSRWYRSLAIVGEGRVARATVMAHEVCFR